ncbi:Protein kinase domain/Protein tyrosine kinase, putative [Entamoeba histolytica]
MAPEILNRQHYKMPSDIYSFSITMLQIIIWQDPFPKTLYPYPLDIADTITTGKRPNIIQEVEEDIKEIIEKSWQQEPKERITIDEIVRMLDGIESKE